MLGAHVVHQPSFSLCLGKPRDERDPKLVEFNKHIEEVVEKEQTIPRTKSTTSNGSNEGVPK